MEEREEIVKEDSTALILKKAARQVEDVVSEMEDAFFDIPFGNSAFQIKNFVINSQYTPERAYRAIGLSSSAKIRALKEAIYNIKKENVDIEELKEKIENSQTSKFERQRAEIELEYKQDNRKYTEKLANDAMHELAQLNAVFKKLPKYTREEFEKGEADHFRIRCGKQAMGITGAMESLDNMGENPTDKMYFQKGVETSACDKLLEALESVNGEEAAKQLQDYE